MLVEILVAIAVVAGLSAFFGLGLAFADRKLAVPVDRLLADVEAALPGVNCGSCGFPGCSGYADGVVRKNADTSLCAPGGKAVATRIAELLGKAPQVKAAETARVRCGAHDGGTKRKYAYNGAYDCTAAHALFEGFTECKVACQGLGDCVRACRFDAISIDGEGRVVMHGEACTGCGACVKACPHKLQHLVPISKRVHVACSSTERGAVCSRFCDVSCIACRACERACQFDAIHVVDDLARVDYDKCTVCGACVKVCPSGCIKDSSGEFNPEAWLKKKAQFAAKR